MKFVPLAIAGAFSVEIELREDGRGHFGRVWCRDEFAAQGLNVDMVQASVSYNRRAGTLRGMHFSRAPSVEAKLVRCARGCMHDVILDLRLESMTFMKHVGLRLDDRSHNAVYVPPGVAHGFQTLVDDSEVFYMMTEAYQPELADGVSFDDPAFGIEWPIPVTCIAIGIAPTRRSGRLLARRELSPLVSRFIASRALVGRSIRMIGSGHIPNVRWASRQAPTSRRKNNAQPGISGMLRTRGGERRRLDSPGRTG